MSACLVNGRRWRYEFTLNGTRHTHGWYNTKREKVLNPVPEPEMPTDMVFLDPANLRLDYLKAYSSEIYYQEYIYKSKRWVKLWGDLYCNEINRQMSLNFLQERKKVLPQTANKEIRYLKATFNYGIKKASSPTILFWEWNFSPLKNALNSYPRNRILKR